MTGTCCGPQYGVGLPPVFGPQGTWPKGRANPADCVLDFSSTFCMRVTVKLKADDNTNPGNLTKTVVFRHGMGYEI